MNAYSKALCEALDALGLDHACSKEQWDNADEKIKQYGIGLVKSLCHCGSSGTCPSCNLVKDVEMEGRCPGCRNEIDEDFCFCGTEKKNHETEEHSFVPMGCDCLRSE